MKKHPRLSVISALILSTSLFGLSTISFAAHNPVNQKPANYKGENYKGEAEPPSCPEPATLRDGIYLGAQIGYDAYRVRESVNISGASLNPVINPVGVVGGLFFGYGKYIQDLYYVGAEIFGNYSGANTAYSLGLGGANGAYYNKVNVRGSYGIALLPGIKINDTLLAYIRLGFNRANFKTKESFNSPSTNAYAIRTTTRNGFNFGLGLETLVYEDWSVRSEFTHTTYSSFSSSGFSTSFNPSDNQFMLGLLYHFN